MFDEAETFKGDVTAAQMSGAAVFSRIRSSWPFVEDAGVWVS